LREFSGRQSGADICDGDLTLSFKLLLMPPFLSGVPPFLAGPVDELVRRLEEDVPGITVTEVDSREACIETLRDTDAVYGFIPPDLFGHAQKLRWIAAPMAGLGEAFFYPSLVESDVVVTNVRGIYSEQLAAHIMAFILAFSHRFDRYFSQQVARGWGHVGTNMDLREQTVFVLGLGGSGAETARLCHEFGMHVIGCDVQVQSPPLGVEELVSLEEMPDRLRDADFVVVTVPETPKTRGLFDAAMFSRMKRGSYLINIARGALVKLDDLVEAIRSGQLAGAGLDVFEIEPLPTDHPLWSLPGVLITPHAAINGAEEDQQRRRTQILIENCRRFSAGEPLNNVVDKKSWF
jgi:phosphoglycerate dehydrogenase-like enzyme